MVTSFGCSDGDAEDRESAVEHGFSALLNMQGAGDEALAVLERLEGGMEGVLGTVLRLMGAQRRAEAVQVFGLSMLNTFTARKGGEGSSEALAMEMLRLGAPAIVVRLMADYPAHELLKYAATATLGD